MVPLKNDENRERYLKYLTMVNKEDYVPSQKVITNAMDSVGMDYRIETNGAHPVDLLRDRRRIPSQDDLLNYMMS